MIGIVSELRKNSTINDLCTHNGVCAWFLEKAFKELNVNVTRINQAELMSFEFPSSEYMIIVSAGVFARIIHSPNFVQSIKEKTRVLSSYLCSDIVNFDNFDLVFTQVKPRKDGAYYAGWGADPEHCYPNQRDLIVFLDSYIPDKQASKAIYDIYWEILRKLNVKVMHPTKTYNDKRLPWPLYQSLLRRCKFFLQTQYGDDGGLNMWEAAASGSLLVSPYYIHSERTFAGLEHRVWSTQKDLIRILNETTNPHEISERASVNTWEKVAKRVLDELEKW